MSRNYRAQGGVHTGRQSTYELTKSWGGYHNFMRSSGLKPGEDDEAAEILDAFRDFDASSSADEDGGHSGGVDPGRLSYSDQLGNNYTTFSDTETHGSGSQGSSRGSSGSPRSLGSSYQADSDAQPDTAALSGGHYRPSSSDTEYSGRIYDRQSESGDMEENTSDADGRAYSWDSDGYDISVHSGHSSSVHSYASDDGDGLDDYDLSDSGCSSDGDCDDDPGDSDVSAGYDSD